VASASALGPHALGARPGALWALRSAPIVWKPFLGGFALAFMVSLVGIISSMFGQQKLHGEARWAQIGEVRKAKLMEDAGICWAVFRPISALWRHRACPARSSDPRWQGRGRRHPEPVAMAGSVVVLDVKQENWDATAGFRPKAAANHPALQPARCRRTNLPLQPLQSYRPPR
jgi:type IV secretion system protein VirD4